MIQAAFDIEAILDSFAGGGGASLGIAWALGRAPDGAVNHDFDAIKMHEANHPDTVHLREDVWHTNTRDIIGDRPVGLWWFSPDCKHFSRAKGGRPVEKKIRSLAWVVIKCAAQEFPRLIILENVREFAEWGPIVPAWRCKECDWRGTEGQTILCRVRRRCPKCNSLKLYAPVCKDSMGKVVQTLIPDPAKKGLTFKRWAGRLKGLGYQVEWRNLNAADYGAPTHRRRLFLVARRDGQPIVWPEPTHFDPKKLASQPLFSDGKPWRTAAECIDWSIPCPSIFDRPRSLAEKTMRRIAMGVKRYVLDNPQPFIVQLAHGEGKNGRWGEGSRPLDEPLGTIHAGGGNHAIVTPIVVGAGGPDYSAKPRAADEPFGTIMTENHRAVVAPQLIHLTHGGERRAHTADEPLPTITVAHRGEMALLSPTLIQTGYGERDGQKPRVPGLDKPLGTVVSGGKHALIAAFLAKHFGGVVGVPINTPLPTTTMVATQNQVVAANLVRMNHGAKQWNSVDEPSPTITTQANKLALVYSFLIRYFGTAIGQNVTEPLYTITGKDRFGLVTVTIDGEMYVVVDIGMRMLTPRELARAQGFPDSYILTGTKTSQVARIGNSVPPVMAKVLVEANYGMEGAAV